MIDGKNCVIQWHKFALETGSLDHDDDVYCEVTNGGMTLELKSKVLKNFLDPEQEYKTKMDKLWEAQDQTQATKEAFKTLNNCKKDELDAIHKQCNRYKKNHQWKVRRIMLEKQVENSPLFFDIYKQQVGGWYVKIGLLEVETDMNNQ